MAEHPGSKSTSAGMSSAGCVGECRNGRDATLRVRLNCVPLYAQGKRTVEIASVLGCANLTAIRAANRFLKKGEAGLLDRRRFNEEQKVDVHLTPKVRRDWMLRGQQKVVVTPGENVKRCVAGALDPRSGEIIWAVGKRRDSKLFLKLLRRVRAGNPSAKRVHIILEDAKAHLSLKVRKAFK